MSKHSSRDKIGKSIDGILGGLTIRGRSENEENEILKLQKKLALYEAEFDSLDYLKKEKEALLQEVSRLKQEQVHCEQNVKLLQSQLRQLENHREVLEDKQTTLNHAIKEQEIERSLLSREVSELNRKKRELVYELKALEEQATGEDAELFPHRYQQYYLPSPVIQQYCDQAEGKRKLTIHLREIEYQAILKASQQMNGHKGKLMETITKALRFYIPRDYYEEAEKEVYQKAIYSVRGFLEKMGLSPEEIEKKIR